MTLLVIYKIDGGEPFTLDLDPNYIIKTSDVKEYIGDLFGVDASDVKLYIRYSKNNCLLEQTSGNYLEGMENRYLFSINPNYKPDLMDTLIITDSLDYLLNNKQNSEPKKECDSENTLLDFTNYDKLRYIKNPSFRRIRK
jgi:hypothetical protein